MKHLLAIDQVTTSSHAILFDELRVGGGAAVNHLLLQFQADLLDCTVVRPRTIETTAVGAAGLAGLATGLYGTPADIGARCTGERHFVPKMDATTRKSHRNNWSRAVAGARSRAAA